MTVHARALNGKRPSACVPSFYSIVQADLDRVDAIVEEVKMVDSPKLQEMLDHVLAPRGKRLRSTVALLAGRFGNYRPRILALLAASIELLHTVTLLHDDVIDSAQTRRGKLTANARYHNAAAVVLGDYIFVAAADIIGSATKLDRANIEILRLFARTGKTIAIGELAQDTRPEVSAGDIPEYFDRVGRKTATLFAASAEAGAMVARAPGKDKAALRDYGQNLGMAFQIVDDILDFTGDETEMGKPIGSDLSEGVLTLPALLLMKRNPADNPVKKFLRSGHRDAELRQAIRAIRDSDILSESYDVARGYHDRAVAALERLPNIPARAALLELANNTLERRA